MQGRLKRRTKNRKRKRISVRFGPKDLESTGFTMDISPEGLSIKTNRVLPIRTSLMLEITIDGKSMVAQGEVKWAKKAAPSLIQSVHSGMGIRLTKISEGLREYLQALYPNGKIMGSPIKGRVKEKTPLPQKKL